MTIHKELLDRLTAQAKEAYWLSRIYFLRNSENDGFQLMLNAIELETILFKVKYGSLEPSDLFIL